ncbi:type II toxin-antitoxin system RelE/ParE family toxin [Candidatus Parcubacteria bacterium]|nr:type II toxin-antitoxin system RelE/ParE family toxin [Candidatus Parcubacteria bacterium]
MYQIIISPCFRKQLKKYAKKYRCLKNEIILVLENFDKQLWTHIGNNAYKIRLKIKDIPKGKSKSFRLVILIIETEKFITPIVLYFKGDRENISKKEINDMIEEILFELWEQK